MRETIYSRNVILEGGIFALGVTPHDCGGPDGEKLRFLQENAGADYEAARTFPVSARYETSITGSGKQEKVAGTITFEKYLCLSSDGQQLDVVEEFFRALDTLHLKLMKIGPRVQVSAQGVWSHLASGHPCADIWLWRARRIAPPPRSAWPPARTRQSRPTYPIDGPVSARSRFRPPRRPRRLPHSHPDRLRTECTAGRPSQYPKPSTAKGFVNDPG